MQNKGIFLALEGPTELVGIAELQTVRDHLIQAGYEVEIYDFPYYDQPSSYFVRNYIEERYGSQDEISPYTSALFFALDRFQLANKIQASLQAGKVVLAHNFTGATMAAQGARFKNIEQQRGFLIWLDNLEFVMLQLPRPDVNLVVTDSKHQSYKTLCELFPKDFHLLATQANQTLAETVLRQLQALKPAAATPTDMPTADFYVPETLDESAREQYIQGVTKLTDKYKQMLTTLQQTNNQATELLRSVLPVATLKYPPKQTLKPAVQKILSGEKAFDAQQPDGVQLIKVSPRNEMDLLPSIAYSYFDTSYKSVTEAMDGWPYNKKLDLFDAYIGLRKSANDLPGAAFRDAQYQWDVVSSFEALYDMSTLPGVHIQRQQLTPRYGYDVPEAIDEAGLTDDYLECFDLSLALHSQLQAAGYKEEAEQVTLLGHKLRWTLSYDAQAAFSILERASAPQTGANLRTVLEAMHQHLGSVHPLLAEAMVFVHKP